MSMASEAGTDPAAAGLEGLSNESLRAMLEDIQQEFDSFRESSAELEQELEGELIRSDKRVRHAEASLNELERAHRQATHHLKREVCYVMQVYVDWYGRGE